MNAIIKDETIMSNFIFLRGGIFKEHEYWSDFLSCSN
jgi:hypothetical protein